MIAKPAEHFAKPPYRAEAFGPNGWAGVMYRDGVNCLVWMQDGKSTGKTITDIETAEKLAKEWNQS